MSGTGLCIVALLLICAPDSERKKNKTKKNDQRVKPFSLIDHNYRIPSRIKNMNININCCIQLLCRTDFRTGILVPGFKSDFTPSLLCAGRKSEHSEKSGPL